ncbi:VOC family protein [Bradyrhizobium sp.]|uniref:VOC family protein n=1 Tax=Bradyrhizobium sp. TaxID=376 RepID=UPI0039E41EAF
MADQHGRFVWQELVTTDMPSAAAFYAAVVGWTAKDASRAELAYTLLAAGDAPVAGLMDLPEEGVRMGATPRWIGYVAVDDIDARAAQIRRLGGAVLVAPTDSNIGRIAVVADPQGATFALVNGLIYGGSQSSASDEPGRVGWHELLAEDRGKVFPFYGKLLGWRHGTAGAEPASVYELFAVAGQTIGGMLTKLPSVPQACWLHYFNVADVGAAARQVNAGGGQVLLGPIELSDGCWIVRCADPQGALFALQGAWDQQAIAGSSGAEVRWSAKWGDIASRGRVVLHKIRR